MRTSRTDRRFGRHEVGSPEDLTSVRAAFTRWLSMFTDDQDRAAEIAVVVSELGANALEATPEDRPPASVDAWLDANGCTVEVVNHLDPADPPEGRWDLNDPLRRGGRGLVLVMAFADDVHIDADDGTIVVWCSAALGDTRPSGG